MEERNCELLFGYLEAILYNNSVERLDIEELDEPYRKLGQGLQVLQEAVTELREYSEDISCGKLSREYPSGDNVLCNGMKNLHSNLRHLTHQAYRDPATGLYNRWFLNEYLDGILQQKKDFVLVFLDLDNLKLVNDRFGHRDGDSYIEKFAALIRETFRSTDVFARIGGDEFCLVLENCQKQVADEKLSGARSRFRALNGSSFIPGFSYGLAVIHGTDNQLSAREILNQADMAMYRDKHYQKIRNRKEER